MFPMKYYLLQTKYLVGQKYVCWYGLFVSLGLVTQEQKVVQSPHLVYEFLLALVR